MTEPARPSGRGFGNEIWLVKLGGRQVLARIAASDADPGKLCAAWRAHRLAWAAGVPTGEPLAFVEHCDPLEGRTLRVVGFVEGEAASRPLASAEERRRFLSSLGAVLAGLHAVGLPGFSSRVDASAPAFEHWSGYVGYRLEAVRARAARSGAFGEAELAALLEPLPDLAKAVDPVVRPALTHRDLHPGNVVVGPDRSVTGVVDWDGAEAWDPVVDFVKVRWQLLCGDAGATEDLWRGYGGRPDRLEERLRILDVLELTNAVANARLDGDVAYETAARRYLARATG